MLLAVLMTACVSSSSSDPNVQTATQNNTSSSTTAVTVTTQVTPPTTTSNNQQLYRLPLHYGLLLGQYYVWNENGGTQSLSIRNYTRSGSNRLEVATTAGLVPQQLITYRGINGNYYSAQIQSISNNTLQLTTSLQQNVYSGNNAWNFYDDGSHPNWAGSRAIADFAIQRIGWGRLNQGKHVLLGDSWFSRQSIFQRLKDRLPAASLNNQGVGGNTARDLLDRFNEDVSWQNPNFVWIMTGTNDYWQDVSVNTYKSNMRQLINRIKGLGATPIIFDSSVGPLNYGSDDKTRLSRSYVIAIDQLIAEY